MQLPFLKQNLPETQDTPERRYICEYQRNYSADEQHDAARRLTLNKIQKIPLCRTKMTI